VIANFAMRLHENVVTFSFLCRMHFQAIFGKLGILHVDLPFSK
jgi:hypothetical protein